MKKYNYIYLIRNLKNNKIYIGKHSTDDINDNYMGSGKLIRMSQNKYGMDCFKKTILCFCDESELNDMEVNYIRLYNSTDKSIGYNCTLGGDGGRPTDEVIQKMRENNLGEKNPNYGKHTSEETKQKLRDALKGRTFSEETKKKMADAKKGKYDGKNNPFYGKKHTEETKKKLRVPRQKYQWLTPNGEIKIMDKHNAEMSHPDWKLIGPN